METAGLSVLLPGKFGLAAPLDLAATYDKKTDEIATSVTRAPGMRRCIIEASLDQTFATGVRQFPGDGTRQRRGGFTPGTWWLRACHTRAADRSGFFGPIPVVVK